MAVLPFGRSGIISASMLGLGRALGETMAVAMVLSPALHRRTSRCCIAEPEHDRGEHRAAVPRGAPALGVNALIATGLVLFVITLLVNCSPAASSTAARPSREPTDDHRTATLGARSPTR